MTHSASCTYWHTTLPDSLAIQALCAESTLHPSCAHGADNLHNRQTWFSSLTLVYSRAGCNLGIQLTPVKLHQQVCNRSHLPSVTFIITNQSRSQPRKFSNSITVGKKSPSTTYITGQIQEKTIVVTPKASSEHPWKGRVIINSTVHLMKCALLLVEVAEGFLYSAEQN